MTAGFLPYGRQEISESDVEAVAAILRTPMITQGPRVEAFEEAFAAHVDARHAVAFSSGTGALHAAACAAGLGPGDEMLTTPVSFIASANCALFAGARPRFADIDATGNLDTRAAVRDTADGVKAVCAVSLAGLPVDLEPLQQLREQGVILIEDGCHALGGHRASGMVGCGSRADMTAFSLHPVKSMTTGEGGMVTTDRGDLAGAMRAFRTHGMARRTDPSDPMLGGWHYDIDTLGFNYRITDFQCALGLSQLERLDGWLTERHRVAAAYRDALADIDGLTLPAEARMAERHGLHLFVVRFTEGAERRRFMFDRLRDAGIGTQLHYIPIPCHGVYRDLGYDPTLAHLPEARAYYEQALSLPMFPAMTEADVDRVSSELRRLMATPVSTS